jgi:hypothetical protein
MLSYNINFRDDIGRLVEARVLDCGRDARAMALAKLGLKPGIWAEIWCSTRYLGSVRASDTVPAPATQRRAAS